MLLIQTILFSILFPSFLPNSTVRISNILAGENGVIDIGDLPSYYSKLIIDRVCDLNGQTIELPYQAMIILEKDGYIDNGTIKGNSSRIISKKKNPSIGKHVVIDGLWINREVHDGWFDFDDSESFISNQIIKNILKLSSDYFSCHIFFEENRIYYFELPYKGKANLGDNIPIIQLDPKPKRRYGDFYTDEYSFVRIFTIPSNTHVTINNKLQMKPTNVGVYFVFWEYGKKNIVIDGRGTISGDAQIHNYKNAYLVTNWTYGEWGHIFCCSVCDNFRFEGITIENSFGDCILYSSDSVNDNVKKRHSTRLVVKNVSIKNARRNGIVIGAKEVLVEDVFFSGCGSKEIRGIAPFSAIDFEPDEVNKYPETGNENVVMKNCVFLNNRHDISSTVNNSRDFGRVATIIENCTFTSPLRLNPTYWIEFKNCVIPGFTNMKDTIDWSTPIKNIVFRDCTIYNLPKILETKSWNNSFISCQIKSYK